MWIRQEATELPLWIPFMHPKRGADLSTSPVWVNHPHYFEWPIGVCNILRFHAFESNGDLCIVKFFSALTNGFMLRQSDVSPLPFSPLWLWGLAPFRQIRLEELDSKDLESTLTDCRLPHNWSATTAASHRSSLISRRCLVAKLAHTGHRMVQTVWQLCSHAWRALPGVKHWPV